MAFEILPFRSGGAAENMALDFLLLQRYPRAAAPRFRHYGWHRPAFTFGYAQKVDLVKAALPSGGQFDLCRRPTGGGIVDHRDDWTFTLIIPRGHPLEDMRATQSYREVHGSLATALRRQGVPAVTKPTAEPPSDLASAASVCFQRAEIHDVVHGPTGAKIAGAAQKRNKQGLLFQGSLWRPAVQAVIDWDQLRDDFVSELAAALGLPAEAAPWPDLNEDEVSGLTEKYSSADWLEFR